MGFDDLSTFLHGAEPIVLPVRGEEYSFPGRGDLPIAIQLRLQEVAQRWDEIAASDAPDDMEVLSESEETELRDAMFGGEYERMVAHGFTMRELRIVFITLMTYHLYGKEAAQKVWGAEGETPAPSRQERRKSGRTRGSRSGSTSPKKPARAGSKS